MDIIMGSLVVLVGAAGIAIACMLLWATIRALTDGKFVTAFILCAVIGVAAYYGKQGYEVVAKRLTPADLTIDMRSSASSVGEWNSDLKRFSDSRYVLLVTPDGKQIRMTAQNIELRKQSDGIRRVWLASNVLSSDDAADLAKTIAREFNLPANDLDAWADRRRHSFDTDAAGWTIERSGRPYVKLTIDNTGKGYWWVGVLYER